MGAGSSLGGRVPRAGKGRQARDFASQAVGGAIESHSCFAQNAGCARMGGSTR